MADTTPGLADLLNLLSSSNPIGALGKTVDNLKKGVDTFVTAVQTFTRTMEALEQAQRTLARAAAVELDEVEALQIAYAERVMADGRQCAIGLSALLFPRR